MLQVLTSDNFRSDANNSSLREHFGTNEAMIGTKKRMTSFAKNSEECMTLSACKSRVKSIPSMNGGSNMGNNKKKVIKAISIQNECEAIP